ncbi:MAG: hypothetical protein Q9214_002980 [Letrouitia sp. 1 TL-2023]
MALSTPLNQSVGYGVVIGVGFLFALGMVTTTYVLKRYQNEVQTSEILLQSSGVAYRYGVSGPFWYASGATVQILLFATLAIELKRKAPNAHTFLEVIRARYGVYTHLVFTVFGLMTNVLVTAMLLTGGSAVVTSLTGMPTAAACFLLPVGVVLYTLFGGIKATFLTDYVHTVKSLFSLLPTPPHVCSLYAGEVMILVIIFIFAFTAYATNENLGSPGKVFDLLVQAAKDHPVEGNAGGSYLTMRSKEGAVFFVINIVGNFGTVFCDNGYYNKAIAASPVHALPGYIMGGLSWFAIPWLAATTMGLSALALESNKVFPTYPSRMANADVTAGLVLPNAAVALLGKGGAAATLLLIFMAVTSASSAEYIAVSSIFTYDIYQTYFDPKASGKRLIFMSHTCVIIYATLLAGFSTGLICSLIAWLVTSKKEFGDLSVDSTGSNNPMLAGNVVALLSPMIFIPVLTYAFGPQNYDYKSMALIRLGDDSDLAASAHVDLELIPGAAQASDAELLAEKDKLKRAFVIASTMTVIMTLALLVLWPMPMYGSAYVFSKKFFTGWVCVGILWLFFSAFCVGLYPLWEGRHTMAHTFKSIVKDLSGRGKPPMHGRSMDVTDDTDSAGKMSVTEKKEKGLTATVRDDVQT